MDRPEIRQVAEGCGEQRKMEETGCEIICSAPMTLAVKGEMMMMINLLKGTLHCCQRSVENRKEWRKLVAKSAVVPQRPPREMER